LEVTLKAKKKFMSDVNLNKSANACVPCAEECKNIKKDYIGHLNYIYLYVYKQI